MRTFEVNVRRDGKWWMIEIPAIDGLTQARRLGDVEDMARSYIAVDQELGADQFRISNPRLIVADEDLRPAMTEILQLRREAREAEARAADAMIRTARRLAGAGVPIRDIGSVLEVSHQRVHQLLNP